MKKEVVVIENNCPKCGLLSSVFSIDLISKGVKSKMTYDEIRKDAIAKQKAYINETHPRGFLGRKHKFVLTVK